MMDKLGDAVGTVWTAVKFVLGCLLLIVPLVGFIVDDGKFSEKFRALESDGVVVDATITALHRTEGARTRRATALGRHNWQYRVEYAYKTKAGKSYTKEAPLEREQFEGLKEGDKIEVLYLPEEPDVQRLTDYQKAFGGIPFHAKIGAFILFGGLGLWLAWRNGSRLMDAWQSRSNAGGGRGVPVDLDRVVAARAGGSGRPRRPGGGFGQRSRA